MDVPFLDLSRRWRVNMSTVASAVLDTLADADFILGHAVRQFEDSFARSVGVAGAAGVASGSDALFLALRALGVQEGDEVITTPFTYVATAQAICECGARPVFVDIDPTTFNIHPWLIESAITSRTKAIIVVHLYGRPAEMFQIMDIVGKYGIPVVEDCAQATGAEHGLGQVGSIGRVGCFSFFPSKNLGGAGDGGAVVSDDLELLDRVKSLRRHGADGRFFSEIGRNSRLDSLQAACLSPLLGHLEDHNETRLRIAKWYSDRIRRCAHVVTPDFLDDNGHVYNQYVLRLRPPTRDAFRDHMGSLGIQTRVYYQIPLHLQPCFAPWCDSVAGDFPHAERAADEVVSLPLYPEIRDEELDAVVAGVISYGHTLPV